MEIEPGDKVSIECGHKPCKEVKIVKKDLFDFKKAYKRNCGILLNKISKRDVETVKTLEEMSKVMYEIKEALISEKKINEYQDKDIENNTDKQVDIDNRLRLLENIVGRLTWINILTVALLSAFLTITGALIILQFTR
jgi:GTPase involved in cell partitioning and DNA repair